jgi:hypothetical protein
MTLKIKTLNIISLKLTIFNRLVFYLRNISLLHWELMKDILSINAQIQQILKLFQANQAIKAISTQFIYS